MIYLACSNVCAGIYVKDNKNHFPFLDHTKETNINST